MVAHRVATGHEVQHRRLQRSFQGTGLCNYPQVPCYDQPALGSILETSLLDQGVITDDLDHNLVSVRRNFLASMQQLDSMGALGHGGNGQFVLGQNTPGIWPQNSYPGYNGDDPWSVMQLRRTGPILPTSDLMDIDQDLALVNYMIEGEAPLLSYQRSIDRDTNNYPVEAPAPDSVPLDGPVLHTRQQYVIDSGNRTTNGMAQELSLRPQIQATLSATALEYGNPII